MENIKKENIFSRMINGIKKGWERLGEPDVDYGGSEGLSKEEKLELERINKVSNPEIEAKLKRIQETYSVKVNTIKAQEKAREKSRKEKITNEGIEKI